MSYCLSGLVRSSVQFGLLGLVGVALAACSTARVEPSYQPSYLTPPPKQVVAAPQRPVYQPPPQYQAPPRYQSAPSQSRGQQITVARGDTLFNLSRRHGVTVSALMSENRLSTTVLSVGQTLRLP